MLTAFQGFYVKKKVTTTIIENKCGETGDSPTKKLRNHVRKNEADQNSSIQEENTGNDD